MAGVVIVFVIMILLEREDLRDRVLRLAGRDLHRTTVAMDDAARRVSLYLSRQLVVNACCGVPIGLLLSTPLTVCLVVLGRHVPQLEFLDVMLGNEPVLAPDETFYQRLLANDPDEASGQAEEFVKERSLAEFFDEVAIPALARAQVDSDDGALTPERRMVVRDGIQAMLENLFDDTAADTVSQHANQSMIDGASVVVCVAGRNELDEAAASLLVHLLRAEHSFGVVKALPADTLTSDRHRSTLEDAAVICLSLISTSSPARGRYFVRRLCRRAPRARVSVGLWRLDPDDLAAAVATVAGPHTAVVTSLRDAVASLQPDTTVGSMPARAC
jgi:hypothetical protein